MGHTSTTLRGRWRWLPGLAVALGVLLVAALVVGYTPWGRGGLLATRVQTGVDSFLPEGDPALAELNRIGARFGGDPVVVLLESGRPGEFFTEPNLLALLGLEGKLHGLPDVAVVYGPATMLNQFAGQAQDFVAELIGRRDAEADQAAGQAQAAGKSPAEVQAARQAALDQFAVRYGPLIVQAMPAGLPTLRNPDFVRRMVFGQGGIRPQWRFVVPSPDSVAILIRPRQDADGAAVERLVDQVRSTVEAAHLPTSRVTVSGVPTVVAALAAEAEREGPLLGVIALVAVALCFLFVPWLPRPSWSRRAGPSARVVEAMFDRPGLAGVAVLTGLGILCHTGARPRWVGDTAVVVLDALVLLVVLVYLAAVLWSGRARRLIPLATTLVAVGVTLSVFGWLHRPLSIGVVVFLSVVLGIGCYYPTYFAVRARVRTVLTVACATALSMATLLLSPLPLVRDLGGTLSVGVVLASVLGILARRLVPPARPVPPEPADSGAIPWREVLGRRRPLAVFAVGMLVASAGWALLPRLSLETDVTQFAAGLPVLADADHVQRVIGSSGELDVTLSGVDVTSPRALAWMRAAEETIITHHGDQARRVISLPMMLDFLGEHPTPEQIDAGLRLLPQYLTGAVISLDRGTSVMIYGVRVDDLAGLARLRDGLLAALPPPPPEYHVELTGLPIVAVRGQQLVSEDRLAANLLGVLAAGLVLTIGLRRRWDALRAVVAAVLATGLGLFLLWLTGTPLSPITVALGSLTAAVGCEFTVLLSEANRRSNPALHRAVLLVTATSVAGYAVLVISGIVLIREFGLLLAGAVLLALLSSLCVVRLTSGALVEAEPPGDSDRSGQESLLGVH